MRMRTIKPEFWRSEDIAALDWDTRLLFIGLWSYVDDNGVGRDVVKAIAADLFALEDDPRETLATVSRGLQALCDGGLIDRYTAPHHGKEQPWLFITAWDRHQRIDRPNKARYPRPSSSVTGPSPDSRDPREGLATLAADVASGTGEQGNRGTGEQEGLGFVENSSHQAAGSLRNGTEDGAVVQITRNKTTRVCPRHQDVVLVGQGVCIECHTEKIAVKAKGESA